MTQEMTENQTNMWNDNYKYMYVESFQILQ